MNHLSEQIDWSSMNSFIENHYDEISAHLAQDMSKEHFSTKDLKTMKKEVNNILDRFGGPLPKPKLAYIKNKEVNMPSATIRLNDNIDNEKSIKQEGYWQKISKEIEDFVPTPLPQELIADTKPKFQKEKFVRKISIKAIKPFKTLGYSDLMSSVKDKLASIKPFPTKGPQIADCSDKERSKKN